MVFIGITIVYSNQTNAFFSVGSTYSQTLNNRARPKIYLVQTAESPKGLSVQPQRKVWLPKGPPFGKFSRQTLRTFHCIPRVIKLSWGAQPQRKVWLPKGPPLGKFSRQTLRTFHCFSDFLIKIGKIIQRRVALGLTLIIFRFSSSEVWLC